MKKYNLTGIGFVLGDKFVGIDIDDCVKEGVIAPEVMKIIEEMDSYAEISPVERVSTYFALEKNLGEKCKTEKIEGAKQIEIYDNGHYFTVTGNVILETGVNERTAELKSLYERYFKEDKKKEPIAPSHEEMQRCRKCGI